MWKSSSRISILTSVLILSLSSCQRDKDNITFSKHPAGYWWRLLAFTSDKSEYSAGKIAWISASFATQRDSVFYDSRHDLRDRLFVITDSTQHNQLRSAISRFNSGDSVCLLMRADTFFRQQFNKHVPDFCAGDSIVRISLRIKSVVSQTEFDSLLKEYRSTEKAEIAAYFGSEEKMKLNEDPAGFYWVEKSTEPGNAEITYGNTLHIRYEGSFLNGRIVDISPEKFQLLYGTPDQLISGLNIVLGKLKVGQNSKIILPSQLAFGENGSSNGSIPPFTPMLYKITVIDNNN